MRKFWGYYDNGKYRVGCNGATIYVYDQNNEELTKFRDIAYAYEGAFQPNTNIFVAKSAEGLLAVYDLDSLKLLKKIVITHIGAQDEGFAFSPSGDCFYNIEKPFVSTASQLALYRTTDYQRTKVLFAENKVMALGHLEFDESSMTCYILGFMRNKNGALDFGFIGKLKDERIDDLITLDRKEYMYISSYKSWELSGFTQRRLEWLDLKYYTDKPPVSLAQVYAKKKI